LLLNIGGLRGQSLPEADRGNSFSEQLDRQIDLHIEKRDMSLERFCKLSSLSPSKLKRTLAKHGTSFHRRLDERRATRAKALLLNSDLELAEIGNLVGFPEPASFSRAFKKWAGVPPGRFRQDSKS
jgi:AraC-like DNA-binding protein